MQKGNLNFTRVHTNKMQKSRRFPYSFELITKFTLFVVLLAYHLCFNIVSTCCLDRENTI